MSSKHTFGTLSTDGWINRSINVIDQMLSDFFLSEYSQTFAFTGKVASFPWLLQQYRSDTYQLAASTSETLRKYFETQFDDVEVEISYESRDGDGSNPDSTDANSYSMLMYIKMVDSEGTVFTLDRIVKHNDLQVTEVIKTLIDG